MNQKIFGLLNYLVNSYFASGLSDKPNLIILFEECGWRIGALVANKNVRHSDYDTRTVEQTLLEYLNLDCVGVEV